MTTLVANVPPVKVWVRKEYLYDLQRGHGEYTPGYWVTCKSLTGRALYLETYSHGVWCGIRQVTYQCISVLEP
jgi:hypothetical protein